MRQPLPSRVRRPLRPSQRLAATTAVLGMGLVLLQSPAHALDLDGMDGLITDTVASRDRQRVWDNNKKYGAESVLERDRAESKPEGGRAGNYLIFPTVGATVIFDDNIYARDMEKISDYRFELTPAVKFQSQLPRHVLDFSLDGKIVSYAEHSDQDYANVRARLDGALHFDHAHTLSVSLLSALEHEERDDPSYPLTAKGPIAVFHNRAAVGITRDVGRLYGTLSGTFETWNFEDAIAVNGSEIDQDLRNTDVYSTQLRWGYRFSPGFGFVSKIRGLRQENAATGLLNRDAWGYDVLAGLAFETNPLLRWHIMGGYGVRDYDNAGVASLATSLMEADVQWLPTQRLTIYGTLSRQILEVSDTLGSGAVQSTARIKADYEIYHNLIFNAGLELREDQYDGINRSDTLYGVRLGLDYYFTKNWLFTFGYEHQIRDSSDDSLDMTRNRFMVGGKLRF